MFKFEPWWVRMFDLPRVQIIVLIILALIGTFLTSQEKRFPELAMLGALLISMTYQIWKVYPYTIFSPVQAIQGASTSTNSQVSILVANVLTPNHNAKKLLQIINDLDPDVILTLESDDWWEEALSSVKKERPHTVALPLNNLYGMHLFSKYPLEETEVRYLIEEDVPSIRTKIVLPSGARFRFYGLHPRPPAPGENETSIERDAELLTVAKEIKENPFVTVVAGDLNDVAWSHTSQLFQKISGLLDPRIGRGFYNTFNAKYPFFRWPLDHVFHSQELQLLRIERLPSFDSDHFPIYIKLEYSPATNNGEKPEDADHKEEKEAEEKIEKADSLEANT